MGEVGAVEQGGVWPQGQTLAQAMWADVERVRRLGADIVQPASR